MSGIPTLPGSTAATVNKDKGTPTKDDFNYRTQLDRLLRRNSFLGETGAANHIPVSDGTKPGWEDLSTLLDAVIGSSEGTIIARGASTWGKLDPADGYLKNTSGVLSWGAVTTPPQWELIEARDATLSANADFTGLDQYQEVLFLLYNIGVSSASNLVMRASVDNGSTFKSANGDYSNTSTIGVPATSNGYVVIGGGSPATYDSVVRIAGLGLACPKFIDVQVGISTNARSFITTTSVVNALRFYRLDGGTPTTGTIYALGLPTP